MIVQCPQCSSQYRVQDDKIPASGGRISCPNCNNSFIVHPDDDQSQQGGYEEDKTSVTDTGQLQNRLAQMAEGMEGEDVDEADPGDVDPTEVMQGPNVPDFMAEDQGDDRDEEEGTREMNNPYAGDDAGSSGGGDQTTQDVESEELLSDAVDDATEVWEGADSMEAMTSESGPADGGPAPADRSAETFDAQMDQPSVSSEDSQSSGPPSPPSGRGGGADDGAGGPGRQQGSSPGSQPGSRPGGTSGQTPDPQQPQTGRKETQLGHGAVDQPDSPSGGAQQQSGGPSTPAGGGPSTPAGGGGSSAPAGGGGGQQTRQDQRRQGSGASVPSGGGGPAAGGGPSGDHDGPWKLKGEHGLTYEFPETDALRNWLTDRDGLEDFELSADGGSTFHNLADFPQIADLIGGGGGADASASQQISSRGQGGGAPGAEGAPGGGPSNQPGGGAGGGVSTPPGAGGARHSPGGGGGPGNQPPSPGAGGGREAPAGQSGGGPPPASDGPDWNEALDDTAADGPDEPEEVPQPVANNDGYELPSRDAAWHKVLYGILVVLIILATGVFLEVAHIYPVGKHIPGVPTTFDTDNDSSGSPSVAESPDETPADKKKAGGEKKEGGANDEKIKQIIAAAEDSIEGNRLQTAIEKLQAAKVLDPKEPRIYELLGNVYEKLGQKEKAKKNRDKAAELKGEKKKGEAVTQKGDKKKGNDQKDGESSGESSN